MFFLLELKAFIIMSMFYQFSNPWFPESQLIISLRYVKYMSWPKQCRYSAHILLHILVLGCFFIVWASWFQVKEVLMLHHAMTFKTTRHCAYNFQPQSNPTPSEWTGTQARPYWPTSVLHLTNALMGASPCSQVSKSFEIYLEAWRYVWQASSSVAKFLNRLHGNMLLM